jgi:hypothetical protein
MLRKDLALRISAVPSALRSAQLSPGIVAFINVALQMTPFCLLCFNYVKRLISQKIKSFIMLKPTLLHDFKMSLLTPATFAIF